MAVYPIVKINGINLSDSQNRWGLHPSHPPRATGVNAIVAVNSPGRDGALWTAQGALPSQYFTVTVQLGLSHATTDPDERTRSVDRQVEWFRMLVGHPRLRLEHFLSASDWRLAEGRLTSFERSRPDGSGFDPIDTLQMVFEIPRGMWWSSFTNSTQAFNNSSSFNGQLDKTLFAGNAVINDARVRVIGPATNPRITCPGTGDWVQYNGTVTAGNQWRFDATTLRAWTGPSSTDWDSNSSMVVADNLTSFGGNGTRLNGSFRFGPTLGMDTDPDNWNWEIGASFTGGSSATSVQVNARKAYV